MPMPKIGAKKCMRERVKRDTSHWILNKDDYRLNGLIADRMDWREFVAAL
uniref:Uncharacterized protein n=1 Tax=Arion vulgaris TaxID=1028688 RepID=A0A0B7BD30_9EUPU